MIKDRKDKGTWEELLYLMLMDMMATQTFIKAENHVKVEVSEKKIDRGYKQGKEVVRKYE